MRTPHGCSRQPQRQPHATPTTTCGCNSRHQQRPRAPQRQQHAEATDNVSAAATHNNRHTHGRGAKLATSQHAAAAGRDIAGDTREMATSTTTAGRTSITRRADNGQRERRGNQRRLPHTPTRGGTDNRSARGGSRLRSQQRQARATDNNNHGGSRPQQHADTTNDNDHNGKRRHNNPTRKQQAMTALQPPTVADAHTAARRSP